MPVRIELTDTRFVYAGKCYPGIPLFVDSDNQFVHILCEYFQHLVILERLKTTTVKTYAEYISIFLNFLESEKEDFKNVDDKLLIRWLNLQEKKGISFKTCCARCDVVFDFYVWLETRGYIQYVVRIPGWNDFEKFVPKLTAAPIKSTGPRAGRSSKYGIVSAVRPRAQGGDIQPTPNADDVTKLNVAADNPKKPDITERNHLLIDWYSQVGLRRHEWGALTLEQVPDWDTIYALKQRNEAHELRLHKTKGDRVRYVGVIPDLLEKTREYIEGPRTDLVNRFKASKGSAYTEPAEIFLSEKTGLPFNLTAISNMLRAWFKVAGVSGHGHRLRATYLTNLFEAEIAAEEARIRAFPGTKVFIDYELILRKVAERAGHVDIESLRPYLTLARKRRAREQGQPDPVTLQQQIDAKKQELALLEHQISQHKKALGL
ncbi:hypothetical protein HFK84_15265 [Ralstonia pseudosolanacearum]|uniref:site-specific integrase n=1 Tax=Ralstonia pseudosolanacearum TaxID=1310165 RepID=UPI0020039168|nr:site-specific integrase [Ralstonia pseudosolanacearum]MCK4143629.1 hypothetical protein [Ralstonia pseudosolanacearum]